MVLTFMAVDVSPFIGKEGKKKTQQINAENQKKKKKKTKQNWIIFIIL